MRVGAAAVLLVGLALAAEAAAQPPNEPGLWIRDAQGRLVPWRRAAPPGTVRLGRVDGREVRLLLVAEAASATAAVAQLDLDARRVTAALAPLGARVEAQAEDRWETLYEPMPVPIAGASPRLQGVRASRVLVVWIPGAVPVGLALDLALGAGARAVLAP